MAKNMYFGINNQARQVKNIFIGLNGKARKIKHAYIGVNNVAKEFYGFDPQIYKYSSSLSSISPTFFNAANADQSGHAAFIAYLTDIDSPTTLSTKGYYYSTTLARSNIFLTLAAKNSCGSGISSYLLFAGGQNASNSVINTVTSFRIVNRTRTTPTALSMARANISAAKAYTNYCLFIGGQENSNYSSTVDAYSTNLSRTTAGSLSTAKAKAAAIGIGYYALVLGGHNDNGNSNSFELYSNALSKTTGSSHQYYQKKHMAAAVAGNIALFAGGIDAQNNFSSQVIPITHNGVRMTEVSLSEPRAYMAAGSTANHALFGGGANANNLASTLVESFNNNLIRKTQTPFTYARKEISAAKAGDYIMFAGGNHSLATDYPELYYEQ